MKLNYLLLSTSIIFILANPISEVVNIEPKPDSTYISLEDKGGYISFYSDRSGNRDIYIMDSDGSNIKQLTTNSASDACPTFSPDSKRIVFLSERDGDFEIYKMNSDGTNQTRLTYDSSWDGWPSWGM